MPGATAPASRSGVIYPLRSLLTEAATTAAGSEATTTSTRTTRPTWHRRRDGTWVVAGPSRLVRPGAVTVVAPGRTRARVQVVAVGREFVRDGVAMRYGYVAEASRGPRCDECGRPGATTTARDVSGFLGRVCAFCARLAEDERRYAGGDALGLLSG